MSSFPPDDQELLSRETLWLRRHMGLGDSPEMAPPDGPPACIVLFFIERAPDSRNGAACKLPTCTERIWPGEYRLALHPGKSGPTWVGASSANADFYHVSCFEKIADFTLSDFNTRLEIVFRNNFSLRGLKAMSILDGNYLVDGGAERLVLEWKARRGKKLDDRDGVDQGEAMEPAFDRLLRQAGSWAYQYEAVPGMGFYEEFLLRHTLAPIESAGEGDTQEWNLFDEFIHDEENKDGLLDRHSLSKMLDHWAFHKKLVLGDEADLTEDEQQHRKSLGEKAVRAIRRLCTIPMPDLQRAFRGSRT